MSIARPSAAGSIPLSIVGRPSHQEWMGQVADRGDPRPWQRVYMAVCAVHGWVEYSYACHQGPDGPRAATRHRSGPWVGQDSLPRMGTLRRLAAVSTRRMPVLVASCLHKDSPIEPVMLGDETHALVSTATYAARVATSSRAWASPAMDSVRARVDLDAICRELAGSCLWLERASADARDDGQAIRLLGSAAKRAQDRADSLVELVSQVTRVADAMGEQESQRRDGDLAMLMMDDGVVPERLEIAEATELARETAQALSELP